MNYKNQIKIFSSIIIVMFLCKGCFPDPNVPEALEQIKAEDGSVWERVCEPGFGDKNNVAVVAMTPFQGKLYAITRNDNTGFEIWQTEKSNWERVHVSGFTDGLFHRFMNNVWGDMIEFKDYLYVSVSSGYQGGNLYKSVGFKIWRFDGKDWEPVISHELYDDMDEGTISEITGCIDDEGETTADFIDFEKSWVNDEWKGGTLWITGGSAIGRVFRIMGNTANTLIVQQAEAPGTKLDTTPDYFNEYTRCDGHDEGGGGWPIYTVPALQEGAEYLIMVGDRINGLGDFWNKSIIDMEVFNDELYASLALNYESGTYVIKTSDGINWQASSTRSFGLFHGYDWDMNLTGLCLAGDEARNGSPVCSSATRIGKSSVTGKETLFIGGSGSTGCNGIGARAFRLDGGDWLPIVDYFVAETLVGNTNESGFGDVGPSVFFSNFQAYDWAEYDEKLFVSVSRMPDGGRVMFTETGSSDAFQNDGVTPTWQYVLGGDSDEQGGFGKNEGYGSNGGMQLYTFDNTLYAGTYMMNLRFGAGKDISGAHLWKMTGSDDNYIWEPVSTDGFGDETILNIESFIEFKGTLYIAASNVNPGSYWEGSEIDRQPGYNGTKIYRLAR